MKVWVLTKKRLMVLTGCLITTILSAVVSLNFALGKERKLPIYCVDKGEEKVISISFDAAWGNEQTQGLLDTLKEKDVKATFFLVGMWVDKFPESVKAIHTAGHDVGNHSDNHPHMTKLPDDKMTSQIEDCNNKIEKLISVRPILFRPPYGDYNDKLVETTNNCKMHCIQWDVDSLDWKNPSADEMITRIKSKIKPGSIILMHNGAKNTPEALPKIIDMIKSEGYRLVPISELIYKENYTMDTQGKQMQKSAENVAES